MGGTGWGGWVFVTSKSITYDIMGGFENANIGLHSVSIIPNGLDSAWTNFSFYHPKVQKEILR